MLDRHSMTYQAMMGEKVFYHYDNDLFLVAQIVRVYHWDVVNLVIQSDGYLDIGNGPGNPIVKTNVVRGDGHLNWCWPEDVP